MTAGMPTVIIFATLLPSPQYGEGMEEGEVED
jgi:hypothetical protein